MKNTTFAFMFALISIFGIHSAASAQLLPGSAAVLNTAHLTQFTNSQPITAGNTTLPVATINTVNLIPVSTTVTQLPTYTAASATLINNANIGIISTNATNQLPQINAQAYPNATLAANNGNIIAAVNAFGPATETTPVVTPVTPVTTGGNTGNTAYSSGSYHTQAPVASAPAVTYTAPAVTHATTKVVYKYVNANPIAESISQSIAEMPADTIDYSASTDSQSAASTFGLGSVNLVTVLLAIAVLLAVMVAYQQYQDRKKKAEHAMYA